MITSTTGSAAGRALVRVEGHYDTDIDDLWSACTEPERLARWIATVDGEPRLGATITATFSSAASGPLRIDACEAPRHLVLTSEPGPGETTIEAWLTEVGEGTRLVVEERGLAEPQAAAYRAGWQTHLEDLARYVGSGEPVHPDGWSDDRAATAWEARLHQLMAQQT